MCRVRSRPCRRRRRRLARDARSAARLNPGSFTISREDYRWRHVAAPEQEANDLALGGTDSDTGPGADRGNHGRTGQTDSDTGPGADGAGRGGSGRSDTDSGPGADRGGHGR